MKKLNKPQNLKITFEFIFKGLFFSLIFLWIVFNYILPTEQFSNYFAVILALTPLLGAIYSFYRYSEWGSIKSFMGISLLSIGISLLMFFIGQSLYFLDTIITTPLGIYDFFFIFMDPLYLIGIYFIAKTIGTFKYFHSNLSLLFLPILLFILNYLVVGFLTNSDVINLLLNFDIEGVFIFGSILLATFITSILIFSRKLGGIYQQALYLVLFGILFQFAGDNIFKFLETQEANGSLADLLFFISISLVTYGVYKLDPNKLNE